MFAAIPDKIGFAFGPASTQVINPDAGEEHDTVFPADAAAAPVETPVTEICVAG